MAVETIVNNLRDGYAELEPGTLQHWSELSADQISDPSLRNKAFYVADFALYTAKGGKPVLGLARHTVEHPNNLVLVHLFDKENNSYDQLVHTGNFRPDPDEARAVLEAADTLKVEMSGLHLSGDNGLYRFLSIRTKDGFVQAGSEYQRPNELEREVLQRVGCTSDFLSLLQKKPHYIGETRLYVLNPDYVTRKAGEEGFIGRAAWRNDFYFSASSSADGHDVNDRGGLRGVRRWSEATSAPTGRDAENVHLSPK